MFQVKDDANKNTKYVSPSKAKVIDNRDPLKRGRIRVDHPILGETVWIDYVGEPNLFNPPKIGDIVYVEADSGWDTHPIARGRAIKGEDDKPDIPEEFRREVPTNRGMHSPGGHKVELDDGEAPVTQDPQDTNFTTKNRGIRITSTGGNKVHIIEDVDSGNTYILIQDAGGNLLKLDYKNNELTINSIGKTKIDTAQDKTETVGAKDTLNVTGDREENIGGKLTINVTGDAEINVTGMAKMGGTAGTEVGKSSSTTQVQGSQVLLAGGGPGVARLGDRAFGIGNLGAPVSSTIIQGSTKVLSG